MELWIELAKTVSETLQRDFAISTQRLLGGGAANTAHRLEGSGLVFFVKLGSLGAFERFRTEALALQEIHQTHTIYVPKPICWGTTEAQAYLVMDFLELGGTPPGGAKQLGTQLAAMHRTVRDRFGWELNNTIGASPQQNGWAEDWVQFFGENRLRFQLRLASRNGYAGAWMQECDRLIEHLPAFFTHYQPQPSLLHGDLWSGNYGFTRDGQPTIFDPALYYGDREADLAMTELFGGFPPQFYTSYQQTFPLDSGYQQRKVLYNLYHLLNHLNIFGSGYMAQVQQSIHQCLDCVA